MFGHNTHLEQKLREGGGRQAWATVLESERQWASSGGFNTAPGQAGSMTIHQRLKLRVGPDGAAPFECTVKQVFNDTKGWHIPEEGYSVKVLCDPDDESKVVIDLESMPVAPGFDRDEALARHQRVMERASDPEARRKWQEEQANAAAQMQAATAMQQMLATQYAQPAGGGAAPDVVADQLTKLADLRDRGVLSDAEFQTQKARLLGES